MESEQIISIDLGGTKTSVALFNNGEIVNEDNFPTPDKPEDFLVMLQAKLNDLDLKSVSGIGVGAAGYWDENCILKQSLNLPKYIDFPIWKNLSASLNLPLFLKTDVELAAMGEAVYGLNNQYKSVLYINMGTGFSGALYKDGEIFTTSYSPTIRLDYLVLPQVKEAIQNNQILSNENSMSENTQPNENTAQDNLKNSGQDILHLSTTIINLAFTLSPEIIVIGGGKANEDSWNSTIQPAIDQAMPYLHENLTYKIKIQPAKLKSPTLYGGLKLVKDSISSLEGVK